MNNTSFNSVAAVYCRSIIWTPEYWFPFRYLKVTCQALYGHMGSIIISKYTLFHFILIEELQITQRNASSLINYSDGYIKTSRCWIYQIFQCPYKAWHVMFNIFHYLGSLWKLTSCGNYLIHYTWIFIPCTTRHTDIYICPFQNLGGPLLANICGF